MTAEVACLGGARKRPWTGVGTKGDRIVGDIAVLAPTTVVVSGHADHPRQRGGKDIHSPRWGRSDEQRACGICLRNDLAQPGAMVGIRSPEAQIDDVHPLLHRPAEGGFEDGNGGGQAIGKNLDGVELDLWSLGSQDTSQSGAVAYAIGVVIMLLNEP